MTALTSRTARSGPLYLLAVDGELDSANADDLSRTGMAVLNDRAVQTLTLDLSGVSFCDAAGIGALIRIRNTALLYDKTLRLECRSNAVEKLLRLTALDTVFAIELPHR